MGNHSRYDMPTNSAEEQKLVASNLAEWKQVAYKVQTRRLYSEGPRKDWDSEVG